MEGSREPIILHFDYDCFYASVIENENPALKAVPLGIQQKNILATCNYVARARGVKKLQLVAEAKKQCKDLVIVNGEDLTRFRNVSKNIWLFVREFIWDHLTERLGFDEIFIDVTEMIDFNISELTSTTRDQSFFRLSRTDPSVGFAFDWSILPGYTYPPLASNYDFPSLLHKRLFLGSCLASFIRAQILASYSHTCSAGISTSKLTAKLAGAVNKPDKQTLVLPGFEAQFLGEHEIGKVPGVGHKTAEKIRGAALGKLQNEYKHGEAQEAVTVCDVRTSLSLSQLEALVGGNSGLGRKMWGWMHGIDDSKISAASTVPTQISIEDSFRPGKVTNFPELTRVLNQLTTKLLQRMHAELIAPGGEKWLAHPRNFRLSVRFHQKNPGYSRISKSAIMPRYMFSLTTPVGANAERLVKEIALGLFKKLCTDKRWELQLVNVAAANMVDGNDGADVGKMLASKKEDWPEKEYEGWGRPSDDQVRDYSEEGKEEDSDWGDEDFSNGSGSTGFEDNEPCRLCGVRFPDFAVKAHKRFHDLGEI